MDLLDALDVAVAEFASRLSAVRPEQWSAPTPCEGWDVRYLVAHVVGGHHFAALVLAGTSSESAISTVMSSTVLGDDPFRTHADRALAQRAAFRQPGSLSIVIDHPTGPLSGAEFLKMRIFDVTLHAWDLARALGVDEQLDAELVEATLGAVRALQGGLGFGIVAVGTASAADPTLVQLLDLSGRRV